MLLLQQMVVLFFLMGIGFFCSKKEIITEEVSKKLSAIVVNIANPALVLTGCMGENKMEGRELLMVAGIVAAVYAALVLLAMLIPRLLFIEKKKRGTYQAMTVFSNIGFMGFPVISAVYGNEALLYASLFMIPYNVLIYTYGVAAMTAGTEEKKKEGISLGRIFNVGVVACIVTIIFYLLRISMPEFIEITITHLSNLTAPLSMM
ncbi:MAG: hypothetical protein HDR10_05835, partial [Lachnospiraceae bacterium]|nr:hypothetical protein [Lachnospiraceae bacterium]